MQMVLKFTLLGVLIAGLSGVAQAASIDWSKVKDADVQSTITTLVNDLASDGWSDADKKELMAMAKEAAEKYGERPLIARQLLAVVHTSAFTQQKLVLDTFLANLSLKQVKEIINDTFKPGSPEHNQALAIVDPSSRAIGPPASGGQTKPDPAGTQGSGNNQNPSNSNTPPPVSNNY
jgi:hypothetical protein